MLQIITAKLSKWHPLEVLFRGMWLCLGLLLFGFAVWQTLGSISIISSHDKYTAEVRRCDTDGAPSSRFNFYQCDVKYRSDQGNHSASIGKLLSKYSVGDEVDIYIGRGEQYSVKAGGFLGLWAIPTLLTIIGCLFAGFGLWPFRGHRKRPQ